MTISDKKAKDIKIDDIEEEIRPKKLVRDFFSWLEQDIQELMIPFRSEFVAVNCPNCNGEESVEDFTKNSFSYFLCTDCKTVFVNPRPTKMLLNDFYAKSKAFQGFTKSLYENENGRRNHIFIPRASLIQEFLSEMGLKKGEILDVGCSVGTMMSIIKEKSSFNVVGLDPSLEALSISRDRGLKVYAGTIEEFEPDEKRFDVVLSFETIEHFFWPLEFVKKSSEILRAGGYFIFSTPNYHGFDIMTLGTFYQRISAPFHLNYFNIDTIDRILDLAGFRVIKKMTPGILDLITVKKQVEAGNAPKLDKFMKYLLFSTSKEQQNAFQEFLSQNCLSGHMLIFAQKI